MLSQNTIAHTVGSIQNKTLNYAPWLSPGETLSAFTLVSSSTTLLVTGATIHHGKHIHFQITGGAVDEVAVLTVTVTTTKGETKIETLEVRVNAP